jgi:hypothetical protein
VGRTLTRARILELAVVCALLLSGLWMRIEVARSWSFVGGDSQGYLRLANSLRQQHRYALDSRDPPHYSRMPLYPMFLAIAGEPSAMQHDDVVCVQIAIDLLASGLLLYLIARRLAGRVAAALALALQMACPFTLHFPSAIMSETLATALTLAAVALVVVWRGRPRLRFFAAGVVCGLGVLARADGLLLAIVFLPALFIEPASWRERLARGGLGLAGLVLAWAPWPLRNLYATGAAHPLGGYVTMYHGPLEHADGYHHWLATWARNDTPTRLGYCFYERNCGQNVASYPAGAFESIAERDEVAALIAGRAQTGIDAQLDERFEALARARRSHRRFYVNVTLPLLRARELWVNRHQDLIEDPRYRPWRALYDPMLKHALVASKWLFRALCAAAIFLLARRRTRAIAAVLIAVVAGRTLVLAFTYYLEPRYLVEVMPLGLALVAAGLVEACRAVATSGIVQRMRGTRAPVAATPP